MKSLRAGVVVGKPMAANYHKLQLQGHIVFNSEGIRQGIDMKVLRYKYEADGELELFHTLLYVYSIRYPAGRLGQCVFTHELML